MVVQSSLSKGTISIALVHEALSAAYAKRAQYSNYFE